MTISPRETANSPLKLDISPREIPQNRVLGRLTSEENYSFFRAFSHLASRIRAFDRKDSMLNERPFAEIFDRLQSEIGPSETLATWESALDPAWMSQVMATLGASSFTARPARAYQTAAPASRPTERRVSHSFTLAQSAAYDELRTYLNVTQASEFLTDFGSSELKSAYRAALLKTHPDHGGTAETFQRVRKSYEILRPLVTK